MTRIKQGPWTRMRPLQRDELDPYTQVGMITGELTWGGNPNNLCKVMAYTPRLLQTGVEYVNTFIFDPRTLRGSVQEAGFNDRLIKELVISRTSLINRSRYSVTHHAVIGISEFANAGRRDEAIPKYLHLHEHEKHPKVYTERERVVLDYTVKVTKDAHLVTDQEFQELRRVLTEHNLKDDQLKNLTTEEMSGYVDRQIVELTWLIGHFCLLNRWFTALQVPNESAEDEWNFAAVYEEIVPEQIRRRNDQILAGGF